MKRKRPLENIVVRSIRRLTYGLLVFSLFAFPSSATCGGHAQTPAGSRRSSSNQFSAQKQKSTSKRICFFAWRSRRDLNSRAGFPTYALSRGASSANLSTTPRYSRSYLRTYSILPKEKMAERVGFEPTRPFGQTVFKTASL